MKLTDPVKSIKLHAQRIPGYLSNTVSTLGDTPGHELAHRVFSLHITSDDSDFDGFIVFEKMQYGEYSVRSGDRVGKIFIDRDHDVGSVQWE